MDRGSHIHQQLPYLLKRTLSLGLTLWVSMVYLAQGTPITSANTNYQAANNPDFYYDIAGSDDGTLYLPGTTYTCYYGDSGAGGNNNLMLSTSNSFVSGGNTFQHIGQSDVFKIQRVDNDSSSGAKDVIWVEAYIPTSGDTLVHIPDYISSNSDLMNSLILNAGSDETFVNVGTAHFSNIERFDYVFSHGLRTSTPDNTGFALFERNGNDDVQVAAILSIDSAGNALTFGPPVSISSSQWGNTLIALAYTISVKQETDTYFRPSSDVGAGTQNIKGCYISLTELGIAPDQELFGYVIFDKDVPASDYADLSLYPNTTSSGGAIDLGAGGGVYCSDGNLNSFYEICNNGIDDDGDGLIDENDPQCLDTDGDGILNSDDIDDDNDGLLDSEESQSTTELFTEFGIGNPVSGTGLYTVAGTNVGYASSFVGSECVTYDAGLQGPALYITKNSNTFTPLRFDFSEPVNNLSFKITDIDWIEEFDLYVYDENFDLYDLRTQGVVSLGSNILQNQSDGRRFSGQGLGIDHDGNDPANDGICSAIFHFPGQVGTIVFNIRTHPGNSIRLTQMTFNVMDSDNDGVIDAWDLDSDNDGLFDVLEAGGSDPDFDGIIGSGPISDSDGDGWSDITDPDSGGTPLADGDTDGDGLQNRIDLDSDADGCTDVLEAGFPDADGDGELGGIAPPSVDSSGVVTSGGL